MCLVLLRFTVVLDGMKLLLCYVISRQHFSRSFRIEHEAFLVDDINDHYVEHQPIMN